MRKVPILPICILVTLAATAGVVCGAPVRVATEVVERAAGPVLARASVRTAERSSEIVNHQVREALRASSACSVARQVGPLIPLGSATMQSTRTGQVLITWKTPPHTVAQAMVQQAPRTAAATTKPSRLKEILATTAGVGSGFGAYEFFKQSGEGFREAVQKGSFWVGALAFAGVMLLLKWLITILRRKPVAAG